MEQRKYRDALIDRAAAAFARDRMDEAAFEAFVARVQGAESSTELEQADSSLVALEPAGAPARKLEREREVSLSMGNLAKRGDWVDADVYRLTGRMSNFELDFRAYRDEPGFFMRLDVDLSMSNLKLRVPADWQVDCRISRNTGSTVKDRGPFPSRCASRVILEGELSMSTIKVIRKGERRGLLAWILGR